MTEDFRDVKGYEGFYQVSNYGNVRSLDRIVKHGTREKRLKGRVLKPCIGTTGYKQLILCKEGVDKRVDVHRLVYENFYGPIPHKMVVDHIDHNPINNSHKNLQCISSRENASKDKWRKVGKKNRYVGVYFNKVTGTYQARIKIGDKRPSLGYFKCETAAHFAYQKKLSCLT